MEGETDAGASESNQAVHILYMGVGAPLPDTISTRKTKTQTSWLKPALTFQQCCQRSVCVLTAHLCFGGSALYEGPRGSKIICDSLKQTFAWLGQANSQRPGFEFVWNSSSLSTSACNQKRGGVDVAPWSLLFGGLCVRTASDGWKKPQVAVSSLPYSSPHQ